MKLIYESFNYIAIISQNIKHILFLNKKECITDDLRMLYNVLNKSKIESFKESKCTFNDSSPAGKLFECLKSSISYLNITENEQLNELSNFFNEQWHSCQISIMPWNHNFYNASMFYDAVSLKVIAKK